MGCIKACRYIPCCVARLRYHKNRQHAAGGALHLTALQHAGGALHLTVVRAHISWYGAASMSLTQTPSKQAQGDGDVQRGRAHAI